MKNSNKLTSKTLLATALVLGLFATQSVIAGEEGPQDEYAGHAHPESSEVTQIKNVIESGRVNYSLETLSTTQAVDHGGIYPNPEH